MKGSPWLLGIAVLSAIVVMGSGFVGATASATEVEVQINFTGSSATVTPATVSVKQYDVVTWSINYGTGEILISSSVVDFDGSSTATPTSSASRLLKNA